MTSFIKSIFGSNSLGTSGKAPSFNDFSMHAGDDAEADMNEERRTSTDDTDPDSRRTSTESLRAKRTNAWQDTFSPQMNSNMKHPGGSFYDKPSKDTAGKTVWEHILKADTVKSAAFHVFDVNNDGLIDAADLRAKLGPDANVEALIKQADKNGDGKIDQAEFTELLKEM